MNVGKSVQKMLKFVTSYDLITLVRFIKSDCINDIFNTNDGIQDNIDILPFEYITFKNDMLG